MSDIRINVVVDTRRARRGFDETERGAQRARKGTDALAASLSRLRRIAGFLGFGVLISSLTDYADALIDVQNRLRFVTDSSKDLANVQASLLRVARETRSNFQGTAELYQRTALAAKNLKVEGVDLVSVVRSVNQAIILSGASTKEASNGLIQLSQGIAANRLGGDELRSVLEQLPVVADVIARQMGVTRGQLRAIGEQGEITGDQILLAFKNAEAFLSEEFSTTVPTIGQALQVLRNSAIDLFGAVNEGTGAFTLMSKAVLLLADNLRELSVALAIFAGPRALLAAVVGLRKLQAELVGSALKTKALAAALGTGFGSIAVVGAAVAVQALGENLEAAENSGYGLSEVMRQVAIDARETVSIAAELAGGVLADAFNIPNPFADWDAQGLILGVGVAIDQLADGARYVAADLGAAFLSVPDIVQKGLNLSIRGMLNFLADLDAGVQGTISVIVNAFNIMFTAVSSGIGLLGASMEQTFKGEFETAADLAEQAKVGLVGAFDAIGRSSGAAFDRGFDAARGGTSAFIDRLVPEDTTDIAANYMLAFEDLLSGFDIGSGVGAADAIADIFLRTQERTDAALLETAKSEQALAAARKARQEYDKRDLANNLVARYAQQGQQLVQQIQLGKAYATVLKEVQNTENRLLKSGQKLTDEARVQIETQVMYNEQLKRVAELTGAGASATRQMAFDQEALKTALDNGVISLSQYHAALQRLKEETGPGNSFADGLAVGMEAVRERVFDLTTSTSQAVQNVAQGIEDFLANSITGLASYFAEALTSGKASWKDFTEAVKGFFADMISMMIQELARLMAQRMMMQLLGGFMAPAGGLAPGFTGASNAFNPATASPTGMSMAFPGGRAIGGTVMANKPYMVGERGPELFFPGRTGSVATNAQSMKMMERAMGGGGETKVVQAPAPQVNVSPQIVLDPSQVVNQGLNDDMIVQAISRNSTQVRSITGGAS